MVDAWPVSLPQKFLVDGFSEQLGDGVLEYAPDAGPTLTRRRSTAAPRPLSGNMEMTSAQLAALKTFYEVTIINGSLPFTLPDPLGGADLLVKFQKGGQPKWSALGGDYFTVVLVLWILP
ncbi:hypothetical protein MA20_31840 [Bradyrhizobium japonicum]|uniref:Uncharacterized protein n=1 Tax=Bradyrhizobium japonicum TaxID=375 RepID=A0A0A3XRJ6_BRAJP|nr:hypothetical protein [Bradyrhizobium japonicum]KGT75791.1 hypothetical protein MA20_31840 [Bradyrhizobium japonicum]